MNDPVVVTEMHWKVIRRMKTTGMPKDPVTLDAASRLFEGETMIWWRKTGAVATINMSIGETFDWIAERKSEKT